MTVDEFMAHIESEAPCRRCGRTIKDHLVVDGEHDSCLETLKKQIERLERERDEAVALLKDLCDWVGEATIWEASPELKARLSAFLAGERDE